VSGILIPQSLLANKSITGGGGVTRDLGFCLKVFNYFCDISGSIVFCRDPSLIQSIRKKFSVYSFRHTFQVLKITVLRKRDQLLSISSSIFWTVFSTRFQKCLLVKRFKSTKMFLVWNPQTWDQLTLRRIPSKPNLPHMILLRSSGILIKMKMQVSWI